MLKQDIKCYVSGSLFARTISTGNFERASKACSLSLSCFSQDICDEGDLLLGQLHMYRPHVQHVTHHRKLQPEASAYSVTWHVAVTTQVPQYQPWCDLSGVAWPVKQRTNDMLNVLTARLLIADGVWCEQGINLQCQQHALSREPGGHEDVDACR